MRPGLLLFFALGGFMGACSGSHEPPRTQAVSAALKPNEKKPILDVPGLLNLPIGELSKRLGPQLPVPSGFVDPILLPLAKTNEQVDSSSLFRYRGLSVVVSYEYRTGQVSNLLLLGADEEQLMNSASLQLGNEEYLVLPVFEEKHPTRLLGVRVIAVTTGQQAIRD